MAPQKGRTKRVAKGLAAKKGTGIVSKQRAINKHAAALKRADALQERNERKLLQDIAELAETDLEAAFKRYEIEFAREAAPWAFVEHPEELRKRSFMLQVQFVNERNRGVPRRQHQYFLTAIAVYGTIDFAFLASAVL